MANIYLQVPGYVAQFYRGREENKVLTEFEPIQFAQFSHEAVLISSSLVLIPESQQTSCYCFSQRAWKNMLQGKTPAGGKRILNRDQQEWLTSKEVSVLCNGKNIVNTDSRDYLCIELPKEILIGDMVRQINGSFCLPPSDAIALTNMLRKEFLHMILDWVIQERRSCNQKSIKREISTILEHFFYRYRIQVGKDNNDRNIMRRMCYRWINQAKMLCNDRVDFDDEDMQFLTEKEKKESLENELIIK